ncbi:MAG: flagellar hook-length control protein FliK [Lachnospiraceae bacterium]|nr:flagellar hook-length control protein FliK [Lachnospiraceae bacterium]
MTGTSINDLKSYFSQTDGQIGLPKAPKDGEDSFTMVMAHAQGKNLSAMGASPEMKAPAQDFSKAAKQPDESSNPGARVNKNENLRRDLEDKKVSGDRTDDKTIDEEISEKVDQVKKQIKDELGISDEQLLAAMEALNLTDGDLLNVDSVKDLMMELSGTENAIDLLTNEDLLASINTVTDLVNESVSELKEEFSADDEMFAGILERFDERRAEGIPIGEMEPSEEPVELDPSLMEKLSGDRPAKDITAEEQPEEVRKAADDLTGVERPEAFGGQEAAQKVTKNQNSSETRNESENEKPNEQLAMPQTIVETEVTSTGEVVQTVREYSSYAENAEIVNQVTEQIKVNISSESTSMEMMLHPASLGAVNIQVSQQGDILHAQILVQNEAVKDALSGQLEQLLKTFAEQGQKVTEVEVSVANYNLERGLDQGQGQNDQNSRGGGNSGRRIRRAFDLNALSDEELSELNDEEKLNAEVMSMSGASVEYHA